MRSLFATSILPLLSSAQLLIPRQANSGTGSTYLNSVCLPEVTSGTIPPCISVGTIETQCLPNGTSTLAYAASAQCLCNAPSSFFADWVGCRSCLLLHGGLSHLDFNRATSVIALVSSTMCAAGASPTAEFASIFADVNQAFTLPVSGDTVKTDTAPSSTAVNLYYTASGSQGPGSITGSATGATKTTTGGGAGATGKSSSDKTGGTAAAGGSTSSVKASGSTTSKSEVRATAAPVMGVLAMVGGVAALL